MPVSAPVSSYLAKTDTTGSSGATTAASTAKLSATEDRFLTLLVTQLKNQDPLNPLDNAQVTSQMAQLSTVSGIDKLNDSIASVLGAISALQPIQAAALVGKQVAVEGNTMQLSGGVGSGAYSLEQSVDAMTVQVKDASGAVVRTIDLGARPAGLTRFDWDGKNQAGVAMPEGSYTFSITASAAGKPVTPTTLSVATVTGIIPASDGFALNLGRAGVVPFSRVAQIL